ncbi:MAG: S1/P1 Nuclease [Bacteroidia bacterium]|nr:S1/P1 Nuclease [Bacteroidia bacterium]
MRKTFFISAITLILIVSVTYLAYAWGFFGHRLINKMAVYTLPPEIIGFYKANIEFIEEHAVDPDKRRYAVKNEAARHYIDVDRYGDHPFDSLPKYWGRAVEKYTEDTLMAHGIVPWHIDRMLQRLTKAFADKDYTKILRNSADLGHYIADAHVPLHCTKNYNGQLTNQNGIHAFWESRLPELFSQDYDFFTGKAKYIDKPIDYIWNIVRASYAAKDSVLLFERMLNEKFPSDQKYSYEQRGANMMKVYAYDYSEQYHKMLDGMVERRMKEAIISVGSFWYTAWVNAGMPNLKGIEKVTISEEEKKEMECEDKMWRTGKVLDSSGHSDE